MDKVKEAGLEENTLTFFLSDNGEATYTQATTNYPFKGGKMSDFEGGLNVPFVMKWKDQIPEGQTYNRPVSSIDVFDTTAAVTGVQLPNDRTFDGVNLLPFVNGEIKTDPHEAIFWRTEYNKIIRKGDWRLIMNDLSGYELLYNLKLDKNERHNVIIHNPDVVEELKDHYSK